MKDEGDDDNERLEAEDDDEENDYDNDLQEENDDKIEVDLNVI